MSAGSVSLAVPARRRDCGSRVWKRACSHGVPDQKDLEIRADTFGASSGLRLALRFGGSTLLCTIDGMQSRLRKMLSTVGGGITVGIQLMMQQISRAVS